MSRRKNLAIGLSLALASALFGLIMLEVFLRLTIDHEADMYVNLTWDRSLDTTYWEKNFLQLYTAKGDWQRGSYDPYLGWDSNIEEDRIRGDETYPYLPKEGARRILAIGDSFTFGAQVAEYETYPYYVESLLENSEALNMGVVAYGIDQAVLKYIAYGSQYKPDLVLFGILPDDYYRSGISFYAFSKPTFTYNHEQERVDLTNTNIPPPQEIFDELEQKHASPKSYLYAFLRNRFLRAYWRFLDSSAKEQYHDDVDVIVEHTLTELIKSIQETNTELLIIQIPNGADFRDESAISSARQDTTRQHLLNLYEKLGISYVDLLEELTIDLSGDKVFNDLYFYKTDSTRGHFTPEGNLEVARIIKRSLEEIQ